MYRYKPEIIPWLALLATDIKQRSWITYTLPCGVRVVQYVNKCIAYMDGGYYYSCDNSEPDEEMRKHIVHYLRG